MIIDHELNEYNPSFFYLAYAAMQMHAKPLMLDSTWYVLTSLDFFRRGPTGRTSEPVSVSSPAVQSQKRSRSYPPAARPRPERWNACSELVTSVVKRRQSRERQPGVDSPPHQRAAQMSLDTSTIALKMLMF